MITTTVPRHNIWASSLMGFKRLEVNPNMSMLIYHTNSQMRLFIYHHEIISIRLPETIKFIVLK